MLLELAKLFHKNILVWIQPSRKWKVMKKDIWTNVKQLRNVAFNDDFPLSDKYNMTMAH